MKIVKLTIHNFLKLKDVEINPRHTNVIVGKNKQGKTSVLKAIKEAFNGGADQSAIRIGENKAEILVELDDLNIRRTITDKGSYLDVSNKEGFKVPAPQKYLDGILGTFSFNPIEFFEKKPIERKKYLLSAIDMKLTPELLAKLVGEKLAGLDFSKHALEVIEDVRKFYYDKRTEVNASVTKKQKTIEELSSQIPEGFSSEDFDENRVEELRKAITNNAVKNQKIVHTEGEIARLKNQIQQLKEALQKAELDLKAHTTNLESLKADWIDTSELEKELASLEEKRGLVHTAHQIEAARTELNDELKEQTRLDGLVKSLAKEIPQKLITEAKLPVEGLSVTDDDVLVNGVSLDNLSASEQLKFGLEIVRKLNGQFKIICIDGVELLDSETFEWFLKEIEGDDFQYFVTRVDGTTPNAIVVEDGAIKL